MHACLVLLEANAIVSVDLWKCFYCTFLNKVSAQDCFDFCIFFWLWGLILFVLFFFVWGWGGGGNHLRTLAVWEYVKSNAYISRMKKTKLTQKGHSNNGQGRVTYLQANICFDEFKKQERLQNMKISKTPTWENWPLVSFWRLLHWLGGNDRFP